MKAVSIIFAAVLLCIVASVSAHGGPAAFSPQAPPVTSMALGAAEHLSCDSCQSIVHTAISLDSAQRATVIGLLDFVCKSKFPKSNETKIAELCEAVVKDVVDLVPWINKELSSLAWNVPLGFCSVFIPVCTRPCCVPMAPPEQVHLSLTHESSEMAVTWVTLNQTSTSTVQWGLAAGALNGSSDGSENTRTYTSGGWIGTIHTAIMTGLQPGTEYFYRVGDEKAGWSETFSFNTFPANIGSDARPLRFIQIGDTGFGDVSNQTIATITSMVVKGEVDVLFHVGDIGYADGYEHHWDIFLNKVQPIASRIPYMTTPGNHELWFDFEAYKYRFWMPTPTPGVQRPAYKDTLMYYSVDIGPLHMIMYDTETWYDTANMDAAQLAWLKADLEATNKQRSTTPWIVGAGHRPLYCSNGGVQCGLFAGWLRYLAEDMFYDNHVDLVIQCHEHSMERSLPLYKSKVVSSNYTAPTAPTYIVNGAGGNREGNANPHAEDWVAFHSAAIGFAYGTITPASLNFQFRENVGTILDQFTITKPAPALAE